MGGNESKIDISNVAIEEIKAFNQIEKTVYQPPFRKFKSQYLKDMGKTLVSLVEMEIPYEDHIEIEQTIYKDLEEAFQQKTKNIQLQHVLFDNFYHDKMIYLIKDKEQNKMIYLKPFKSYDSHAYGNIICQLNITKRIASLASPHLSTLQEHYIIQTGIEEEDLPNTQIMIFQPADTTLSEIIQYRRENNWPWTINEFNFLVNNLVDALHTLHSHQIAHNDIRPSNIFYSVKKNCYTLGCFQNSLNSKRKAQFRTSKAFRAPQLQKAQQQYSIFESDVYSLGVSLLCAFYLCQPINVKAVGSFNRKYTDSYRFFDLIRTMVRPQRKDRFTSAEMVSMLIPTENPTDMSTLIQSLKYKNSPKNKMLVKEKIMFSNACQRLGLWNEWKANLTEALQLQESELDDFNKASRLQQIAQVEYCRGEVSSSSNYAKKAAKLYRNLGYSSLEQGNIDHSISLFTKAADNAKYFDQEDEYDMAKNLQGLSAAHKQKNEYEIAKNFLQRAILIIQRCRGKDSGQCIQLKIAMAKLETDFQEFAHSHMILEECLKITQQKSQINKNLSMKIKAQILQEIGKNYMHQSTIETTNKDQFSQKSQKCLAQALKINESFETDNYIAVAENLQVIGQILFKKKQFNQAKTQFTRAIGLREHFIHQNDSNKPTNTKEKADLLCHIAHCDTSLQEYDKAMENYQSALQIYKKIYGSDHNFYSAMTIGNMGRIYKNLNDLKKAKECVKCASDILAEVRGVDDPDYEYFKQVQELLNSQ